jgi:hypothetical protein
MSPPFLFSRCITSASTASLFQLRAMSSRVALTLAVGARSAIFWHSAARSLHSSGVNIASSVRRMEREEAERDLRGHHQVLVTEGG